MEKYLKNKRIFLAGLYHETNTFAPGRLTLGDFRVLKGEQMMEGCGNGSPLGTFLEEAKRLQWEVVPLVQVVHSPGPMVEDRVVEFFLEECRKSLDSAGSVTGDALFLVLHGAMCTERWSDAEGEVLAQLRSIPSLATLPIFGTLDLHANFTQRMAQYSNGLLTYRENPHTDAAETARRAVQLLHRALKDGNQRLTRFVATNILWPPTGTGTSDEPMKGLEKLARHLEGKMSFDAVNVFAGFAHADTPDTGVSFSILYDPHKITSSQLDSAAEQLTALAEQSKKEGLPEEWDLEEAIVDALEKKKFPVCLVEPADNIGGGSPGDDTSVLRALLRHGVRSAGVVLNSPAAVAQLSNCALGSEQEVTVGGWSLPACPGPLRLRVRLVSRTDGNFRLEDRQSHQASMGGVEVAMGPCALVEAEGISILLTSRPTAPMDLGQWRSQGCDPEKFNFLGIKAAVAHRRAYNPIVQASYTVRTPGPSSSDLTSLSYQLVRRPSFPLDD